MTTKAPDILTAALSHMQDRAATYDKPEGERSMPATVAAFNALTGHNLTAEQGWLFMTVLKLCRTQQGGLRPDNYEDGAAYFALMGEQAAVDRLHQMASVDPATGSPLEPLADIEPEGATHRWTETNQYAKRAPWDGWAIWQEGQWVWLGSEFRGSMVPVTPWVEHDGKGCPVPEGTMVQVRYRERRELDRGDAFPTKAGALWTWPGRPNSDPANDIVAYRLA